VNRSKNGEDVRFGLLFRLISNTCKKDMDNYMKTFGLTMTQSMIIEYLNNSPPEALTPRAIEQFFELRHPTVSGLLKRLEAGGFIECSVNEKDRRVKDLRVTEKARLIDENAKARIDEYEAAFAAGFSEEEATTLRALLLRVLDNIS
jgi:DNA-binding MarR family transcriptional regulator